MGDARGFLKFKRGKAAYRPVCERIRDFAEVALLPKPQRSEEQASRCMDCGTPFCHWGCPVGNYIPEWNDAVFHGRWEKAAELLSATNNLAEITGRVCPAPCEFACVLGINDDPVTIRENELAIIEYAFQHGFIRPRKPGRRTGKKVAVIGSGPAGLSCAAQLNQAGHTVEVFEAADKAGGLLRYGIPDFKLDKRLLERRIGIWKKEGIRFVCGTEIGRGYAAEKILKEFDALCLTGGSRMPRDLRIEGRSLAGIHFALDYLVQANRASAGEKIPAQEQVSARGKRVVVIGGGDTGADCVGVAHRQGASCVVQIELLSQPSECRPSHQPWPEYPLVLKTSSSHEEGGERKWAVLTKKFIGARGAVQKLSCVRVEFSRDAAGCPAMKEITGSDFEIETDLVILALGFLGPRKEGLLEELGLNLDERGNVKTDSRYLASRKAVFSAGDMRRGQSLIVWAIAEGRRAAHHIDTYLTGSSNLPLL